MTVKSNWENGEQFNASDANAVAEAVNAAYVKPATGVPITDLTSGVQVSLGKADTAVQSVTSTSITDSTTTGRAVITATDASAARTTLGVAYGTTAGTVVEGNDSRLTPTAASITDSTATGRSLLTAVDPAAARTTLGVAYGTASGTVAQGNDSRITGAEQTSAKGAANGYASLDSGGKVPATQLPNSVMEYQGVYNASTNTPSLVNGTGNAGDVYRVSVAGSRNFGAGAITLRVGDYVLYSGTVWERSATTDAVATVAGRSGDVTLTTADVSGAEATANKGAVNGYAGLNGSAKLPIATLATSGTADASTYLRGDGAWSAVTGGYTRSVAVISSPTVLGEAPDTDYYSFVAGGSVTLPAAAGNTNVYTVTNTRSAATTVASDSKVVGLNSISVPGSATAVLASDGETWRVVGTHRAEYPIFDQKANASSVAVGLAGDGGLSVPFTGWTDGNPDASATFAQNALVRTLTLTSGNTGHRMEYRTAPLTSGYTFTINISILAGLTNSRYGLYLRESSSGRLIAFHVNIARTTIFRTSLASATDNVGSGATSAAIAAASWLRVRDDGTDRIFEYSSDGSTWTTYSTESRTEYLVADQIGWGMRPTNVATTFSMTVNRWIFR